MAKITVGSAGATADYYATDRLCAGCNRLLSARGEADGLAAAFDFVDAVTNGLNWALEKAEDLAAENLKRNRNKRDMKKVHNVKPLSPGLLFVAAKSQVGILFLGLPRFVFYFVLDF